MQDIFTKGMERWFAVKEFHVGIPTQEIDQNFSTEDFQARIENFTKYSATLETTIGVALRLLARAKPLGRLAKGAGRWGGRVSKVGGVVGAASIVVPLLFEVLESKTTAADFYEALKPYISKSDLIGLKVSKARAPTSLKEDPEDKIFWATVLVPVIYADELAPASIRERFKEFLEASDSLKRLGLRAKLVGNRARIYPLLVYFDNKKLEEYRETLWPHIFEESEKEGLRPRTLSHRASWAEFKTYLSAGVVNVPGKRVISEIFDEDDLHSVLKWGRADNDKPSSGQ
jgi:hypothetical protein